MLLRELLARLPKDVEPCIQISVVLHGMSGFPWDNYDVRLVYGLFALVHLVHLVVIVMKEYFTHILVILGRHYSRHVHLLQLKERRVSCTDEIRARM
jgi:hypothetical protein